MSHAEDLIDLQMRFAYQEDAMRALSDEVARQQRDIEVLQATVRRLAERLERLGEPSGAATDPAEERPPHW